MLLVSHDRALLDAVADRTLAIEDAALNAYDGGWADYVRQREERAAPAARELKPRKEKPNAAKRAEKPRRPTELERIEAEIAERETRVAELERRLSEDWSDVDVLAEHRRARDDLQALLQQWEALFERAQT